MLNILKKKGTVNDTEKAELLDLLDKTVHEMIWFEIENEGQQTTRDRLVVELATMSKVLRNKWST